MNTSSEGIAAVRPHFTDRAHAGQALARTLRQRNLGRDVTVIGLARGGVPVARHVADGLCAPLGVMVSSKVGVPGIEDVALGAVAEGGDRVVADAMAWYIGVPPRLVDRLAARERVDVERRAHMYRGGRPLPNVKGRTVILVDDGLVTGATLRAAAFAIRKHGPRRVIAAVPVASISGAAEVRADVDDLIALIAASQFDTIASWYDVYDTVTDEELLSQLGRPTRVAIMNGRQTFSAVLRDVGERIAPALHRNEVGRTVGERSIAISCLGDTLTAEFGRAQPVPDAMEGDSAERTRGLVVLVDGGSGSRHGYRHRYIAGRLRLGGYATLRVDLLTSREHRSGEAAAMLTDVARIADRLTTVCDWAARAGLDGVRRTILIGANTGAAAALATAAHRPARVAAVIARAGRVELAADFLPHVFAPVLLIVGESDRETLRRNGRVLRELPRGAVLIRVPGASHTFAEPGALGAVAEHTVRWLDRLDARSRAAGIRQV